MYEDYVKCPFSPKLEENSYCNFNLVHFLGALLKLLAESASGFYGRESKYKNPHLLGLKCGFKNADSTFLFITARKEHDYNVFSSCRFCEWLA